MAAKTKKQPEQPQYDPKASVQDNVYAMRVAGFPWRQIEEACGLAPFGPAQRAFRAACEERGEQVPDFRRKGAQPAKKKASKPAAKKATAKKAVRK